MKFILIFLLGVFCCTKICAQRYKVSSDTTVYILNDDAIVQSCRCYQLTKASIHQHGSVWNKNLISLKNSFTFVFDVNLGIDDAGGADGIAFVLQQKGTSIGSTGSGLGIEGVNPSVAVTLDTWYNDKDNDPAYDHLAIQLNGDLDHNSSNTITPTVQISATSDNVEDGLDHRLKISWDAAKMQMDIYFDDVLRLSQIYNFVDSVFNSNPQVYWGFTASTGNNFNIQKFCTALIPSFYFAPSQKLCANRPIKFNDTTYSFAPIVKSYWNFGDGNFDTAISPTHTYKGPGPYTVTQTVLGAEGCTEINTQQILVDIQPVANFTYNNVCVNNTVQFTDASTIPSGGIINSWYWDLGDGNMSTNQNPSKFYMIAGSKKIKLAVMSSGGCASDTTEKILVINPKPVADFSFTDNQCIEAGVQFNDLSKIPTGSVISWSWNFGNGKTSTQQNPLATFSNSGPYNVALTCVSDSGCASDAVTKTVSIRPKPVASFFYTAACEKSQMSFFDSSYSPDGSVINNWYWDFGNGQTSTLKNPSIVYNNPGPYTIKFVAGTYNCVSDTIRRTISVDTKPAAGFIANNSCQDSSIILTDASSVANSTITNWYWDFGNGQTSTLQNPSVTYTTSGNKIIKHAAITASGCVSDTMSKAIEIYPKPIANFNFTNNLCEKTSVQFTDLSTGNIAGWYWNFGNGLISTQKNPLTPYNSSGTFQVSLVAQSDKGCNSDKNIKPVTITPKPVANFLYNTACQSTQASFIDSSFSPDGSAIKTWWWDLGNGQTSTQPNPSITYSIQANYTVKLVVTTTCISDTFTKVISVNGLPSANFSLNNACQDSTVNLIYIPSGSAISSWYWTLGNGQTSTLQNPTVTYSSSGIKKITLTVTSVDGCVSDTTSKNVEIYPKPTADFSYTNNICQNAGAQFTDQSTGNVIAWYWDFGNGQISAQQNPLTQYNAAGTFQPTLVVQSDKGCRSDAVTKTITITPKPIAYFKNNIACESNSTMFTDSSYSVNAIPVTQWYWDFGNGKISTQQNPSLIYALPGTYTVKLVVTANCISDTFSKVITVSSRPVANFSLANACQDSIINLSDASAVANSTINTWQWDFGNGQTSSLQNPSVSFNSPGIKTVRLIVISAQGCVSDTAKKSAEIYPKPVANFSVTNNICQNEGVQFTDQSTGNVTAWQWNFGNGQTSTLQSPLIPYSIAGTYQPSLVAISDKGCRSDAITKSVTITPKPIAYFKNSAACESYATVFSDSSYSINAIAIKQWYWDFGNGKTSTQQNPTLVYSSPGNYTVRLVVIANCISDTFSKTITVYNRPTASFTNNSACQDSVINLTDASSVANSTVTNWYWNFGNGQTSTLQNPSVTYTTSGNKIINLVATSAAGCVSDTASRVIAVYPKPVSDFSFINNSCQNSGVVFTDKSVIASGTITAWQWNLGNGQASVQQNPVTQFNAGGTYQVSLTAQSDKGCRSDAVTKSVTITPKPLAYFKNNIACQSSAVIFTDSSYSLDGQSIKQWYWNFGNGQTSTLQNPSIIYSAAGSYAIRLVVNTNCTSDTFSKIIIVNNKPVASFTNNNACQDSVINLSDASSVANSTITNWYWNFGNGQTSTLQNPSVTYSTSGNKIIKLVAASAAGCLSDTTSRSVEVYPKPVSSFSFTNNSCQNTGVMFTDKSVVTSGTITTWQWNLGNGQTSAQQNPVTQYNSGGAYQVSLTAKSDKGCRSDAVSKTVTITPKPVAYFKNNIPCLSSDVVFTDSSYSSDGQSIKQWYWDFGNGQTSTLKNPAIMYATIGSFTVRLIVNTNCTSDTFSKVITLHRKPVANFTTANACQDSVVTLTDASSVIGGTVTGWQWNFGNGQTSTLQNPVVTYNSSGYKTIKLAATSAEGCVSDTVSNTIEIYPKPTANFTFTNSCLQTNMQFTDASVISSGTINAWQWNLGNGQTSALQNPSTQYNTAGAYQASLIVQSSKGCGSIAAVKTITIAPKPVADFNYSSICQSAISTFTDQSYTNDSRTITGWYWDLGNGQTSTLKNPSTVYSATNTVTVKLLAKASDGCFSDTTVKPVTVNVRPVSNFNYSAPLCADKLVTFTDSSFSSAGAITNYSWQFDNTGTSNLQNPVLTFIAGNHTAKLSVKSSTGCISDTTTKSFIINNKPVAIMNFADACLNTAVNFSATYTPDNIFNSFTWNFGDNNTGSGNNLQHTYTALGTYPVSLFAVAQNGCITDTLKRYIHISIIHPSAGSDVIASAMQPVQLQATGAATYAWSPSAGLSNPNISNPIATVSADQTYYLKAVNSQGCAGYDTVTIKIYKGPDIYVPNAFTPNNNGVNDLLKAVPVGIVQFNYLKIYNRWGQEIFATSDYNRGWDGRYKGIDQPVGNYVWIISAVDYKGNAVSKRGTVLLMR